MASEHANGIEYKRAARMRMSASLLVAPLFAVVGMGVPGSAYAARLDYEFGLSVLQSDNIGLSPFAPVDETVVSPNLRFQLVQEGPQLRLDLRGTLQYLDYLDDTFDDEVRADFNGQALWTVVPERMTFTFEDYLSQQPIDTLAGFSPGNNQQTNVFVAGPTFLTRFGAAGSGQLDLRYANRYAEETSNFNSDRYSAALRLLRGLSGTQRLSFNLEAADIDYDTALASDYRRYDGFVGYQRELKALDLDLALGYTRLETDNTVGNHGAPLLRADLDMRLTPRSTLNAGLAYELGDAADRFSQPATVTDPSLPGNAGDPTTPVAPDIYRQRRLSLRYNFESERVRLQLSPYYQRLEYLDSLSLLPDQVSRGASIGLDVRLRPRLSLVGQVAAEERQFGGALARRDQDWVASIGLDNRFTRHWSGQLRLQRRQRDSSEAGQDYRENAAIVSITYRR